jgi:hypothetical protein
MTVRLNRKALSHAQALVSRGRTTHDRRDDWSDHAPTTDEENEYIEQHGWRDYGLWHLGVDEDKSEETKGRYSFPYGDFTEVHRCAVIALEGRAAQNDHADIARATKRLLNAIDDE